jgi:hypothetical protein
VRVFGLEESEQENVEKKICTLAKDTLGVELKPSDIVAAHRLPLRPGTQGPRSVIVKFVKYATKEKLMRNRRKLKGKRMGIADDLCREYHQVINRAIKHPSVNSCWYWNGKIFIEDVVQRKGQIRYGQPIQDALDAIADREPLTPGEMQERLLGDEPDEAAVVAAKAAAAEADNDGGGD